MLIIPDNARPQIPGTVRYVFTNYKREALLHPNYSTQTNCPDFLSLSKLKERLHGQQFKSSETINAAMTQCIRSLIQADN
jgi:hypothetical protein